MVQIIPAAQRKPSFGEQIGPNIARTLDLGQQLMQQQQQQQQIAKENAFAEKLGLDLSGTSDPKTRQALMVEALKMQSKNQLNPLQEAQKQLAEARTSQARGQTSFFDELMGRGNQQDAQFDQSQGQQQSPGMERFPETRQQTQIDPQNPQTWPEDALKKAAGFRGQPGQTGVIGNIAQAELDRRKEEEKKGKEEFYREREYHTSFSKDAEKEAEQLRSNLGKKEMSLNLSRDAVESGEVGALSLANLASRLKIPEWQTMKGAQLETAIKENLLSNMSRVSAKGQNIWFEQRLNSMMAQIGKSQQANLSAQEILEGEVAMDRAYLDTFDKISDDDMQNYNFVKKDIAKRARSQAKPLENEIMKRTSYRLKELEEQEKGLNKVKSEVGKNVIKGTPMTLAMAKLYKDKFGENALKVAQKNGYYIPTLEEFRIFQQRPQEFREELVQ